MFQMLQFMPISMLYGVIAMALTKVGHYLKDKDPDNTGSDDAAGNVLLAMAPAIAALEGNNGNATRKALVVVRDTIDGYLKAGV